MAWFLSARFLLSLSSPALAQGMGQDSLAPRAICCMDSKPGAQLLLVSVGRLSKEKHGKASSYCLFVCVILFLILTFKSVFLPDLVRNSRKPTLWMHPSWETHPSDKLGQQWGMEKQCGWRNLHSFPPPLLPPFNCVCSGGICILSLQCSLDLFFLTFFAAL